MNDLASSGRAVTRAQILPYSPNRPPAPADLLRAMLNSCRSPETLKVWNQDFIENLHLISYADRMDIVAKSTARRLQIAGRA